jgi:SAM-dependent MidA family methyltransferase
MNTEYITLESNILFADSKIWDLNRSYYHEAGLSAWSDGVVPHNITSNAYVGKTYAAMILGFLKDLKVSATEDQKVYIIELGAGHGRLGYHILQHLEDLMALESEVLPAYCYVLTDIVESNLSFFEEHPQLEPFFLSGKLDVAYYDGVLSNEVHLRKSKTTIQKGQLYYPLIAIANYFFDSLPNDLFYINNGNALPCTITLETYLDVEKESAADVLQSLKSTILQGNENQIHAHNLYTHRLLEEYTTLLHDTYVLSPRLSIQCIETLRHYSAQGIMLLTIDKGVTELGELQGKTEPQIIHHGSFSIYVNFDAIARYATYVQGKSFFAMSTDSTLQLGCLLLLSNADKYHETYKAYTQNVTGFGPDDFNGMKKMVYRLVNELTLKEIFLSLKMGLYDSNLFLQLLPIIKKKLATLSIEDSKMLIKSLQLVEKYYFDIKEPISVSYEIAGIFYDLGFHKEALEVYEQLSMDFGEAADVYYNRILCYYQLRMDDRFSATLIEARRAFPAFDKFDALDKIDLSLA